MNKKEISKIKKALIDSHSLLSDILSNICDDNRTADEVDRCMVKISSALEIIEKTDKEAP